MIIGVSGKKQHGKDLIGKIINYYFSDAYNLGLQSLNDYLTNYEKNLAYIDNKLEIIKFATKLKQVVATLIDCNVKDLEDENFKNKGLGIFRYKFFNNPKLLFSSRKDALIHYNRLTKEDIIEEELTPRLLLQEIGTDCIRNVIHPNFWVLSTIKNYNKNKKWVITDVRFPNEARIIKENNGILIRVYRPNIPNNNHISETALDNFDFDYVIHNDKDINHLSKEIYNILKTNNLIQ